MRTKITICDLCRGDGTIRPAVGYYWNRYYGRLFDVCHGHMEMILEPGMAAGYYNRLGVIKEDAYGLPNLGIFHEIPEGV